MRAKVLKLAVSVLVIALTSSLPVFATPRDFSADAVLGQKSFTANATGATATKFNNAYRITIDPTTQRLYVADTLNNRILSYPSTESFSNDAAADLIIGQSDFTSVQANRGFRSPTSRSA